MNSDSANTDTNGVFEINSLWTNITSGAFFRCKDATPTAADWVELIDVDNVLDEDTFTSDSAVYPPSQQSVAANQGASIYGLLHTRDAGDTDHDLNVTAGYARDFGNAVTMHLTGEITKKIDATWAVGDDAGGMDSTDTVGNETGYGVYLIRRSDTGVVDVMFSTDMTAAGSALTLPTNYDQKRLIGWVMTDSSANILAFIQSGDNFQITGDIITLVADVTITTNVYETVTMPTPPLCLANIYANYSNTTQTDGFCRLWIRTKNGAEAGNNLNEAWMLVQANALALDVAGRQGEVLSDLNSQIEYTAEESTGVTSVNIRLLGCNLLTRSNP